MIAFVASGLWHGAAWHYVVWGAWHGAGLVVCECGYSLTDRLKQRIPALARAAEHPADKVSRRSRGWFVTFNYVMLGWVSSPCRCVQP